VAAYKKKIVAFLVAVAFVSSGLVVPAFAGTPPLQKAGSAQSATVEETKLLNFNSPFKNDPNYSLSSANSLGTGEMFFKMMLSIVLVVVLGAAAIYISKKFLPRITNLPGKKIRIIETAHIGPRKMVHLVKIGNQRLLIGSTNENITKLADVTDALLETDLSATETDSN
jgi:flagellar biosynthetic protein FliO